jgi:hypothetical protein
MATSTSSSHWAASGSSTTMGACTSEYQVGSVGRVIPLFPLMQSAVAVTAGKLVPSPPLDSRVRGNDSFNTQEIPAFAGMTASGLKGFPLPAFVGACSAGMTESLGKRDTQLCEVLFCSVVVGHQCRFRLDRLQVVRIRECPRTGSLLDLLLGHLQNRL